MTLKELRNWFELIPHKFDSVEIQEINVDYTRPIDDLNLVITSKYRAIIATLMRQPTYIENKKETNEDL